MNKKEDKGFASIAKPFVFCRFLCASQYFVRLTFSLGHVRQVHSLRESRAFLVLLAHRKRNGVADFLYRVVIARANFFARGNPPQRSPSAIYFLPQLFAWQKIPLRRGRNITCRKVANRTFAPAKISLSPKSPVRSQRKTAIVFATAVLYRLILHYAFCTMHCPYSSVLVQV